MKLEIIQPQSQIKITTVGIQGPKGEPGERGFDTGTSGCIISNFILYYACCVIVQVIDGVNGVVGVVPAAWNGNDIFVDSA